MVRSGDATPREPTPEEKAELAELQKKLEDRGVVKPVEKNGNGS